MVALPTGTNLPVLTMLDTTTPTGLIFMVSSDSRGKDDENGNNYYLIFIDHYYYQPRIRFQLFIAKNDI